MSRSAKGSLIYQTVLEYLKGRLLAGELRPGARLPTVAALARQLGVGLASVREAYRVLESQGILEVTQGRGTFVTSGVLSGGEPVLHLQSIGRQTTRDLVEAARIVKPEVAALAAQRATDAEIQAIVEAAAAMARCAKPGDEFAALDTRFDALIFAACHNSTLARLMTIMTESTAEASRQAQEKPGHIEKAVKFHNLIALAIKERNPEAARAFMSQHVADVERDLFPAREGGEPRPK